MNKAPWKDFSGADIHENDVIVHPTGERGTVIFFPEFPDAGDQWRVLYTDGGPVSRLCLQIGDKGQAVVEQSAGRRGGDSQ